MAFDPGGFGDLCSRGIGLRRVVRVSGAASQTRMCKPMTFCAAISFARSLQTGWKRDGNWIGAQEIPQANEWVIDTGIRM